MNKHSVEIYDRHRDQRWQAWVREDQYILDAFEEQGIPLPVACGNGACTTCAVRILGGTIDQREAVGLSRLLQEQGYGLICIGYPRSDLKLETQDENEVYQLQFGQYFQSQPQRRFSLSWLLEG